MVERHEPPVGDEGKLLDAPAGDRMLAPQGQAHVPHREAGIPGGWVEHHCCYAGGQRERYGYEAVLAQQQHKQPRAYGEYRAPALAKPDRRDVGRAADQVRIPPRYEQHDSGEGAEVVRRAEWSGRTAQPGRLYHSPNGRPYGNPYEAGQHAIEEAVDEAHANPG